MPLLLWLMACSWPPWGGVYSPVSDEDRRINALIAEIEVLQDRVTELEAAPCLTLEDLPREFDAYITVDELREQLTAWVHEGELADALDELVLLEEFEEALDDVATAEELDALAAQVVPPNLLQELLNERVAEAELAKAMERVATRDEVAAVTADMATRAWVEEEILLRLDLILYRMGGYPPSGSWPNDPQAGVVIRR